MTTSTPPTASAPDAAIHAELDAVATAWDEAIVADDPNAIARYAEPDWVLIGATGIITCDRFLEVVRNGLLTHHTMSHEIVDVRLFDDVAVVVSRVQNTGAFDGEEFTNDEWTTDVYVRRGDTWRCSVTQLTAVADAPTG
ncbi:MAG: nuclear transport factor 2 family protein [Actinomycetota bacterium]|nr:nuclear transport factor 2 family protein [Actinomycetota bacterium]